MKKIGLILSSSKRSRLYYNKIKNIKNVKITNIIYYGNKIIKFKKEDFQKTYFFSNRLINPKIARLIKSLKEKNFVISPMPGEIIKDKILLKKKNLIHFHPGNLPNFKGSTVLYYTTLFKKKIFCTGFFLKTKIDEGKILIKKSFIFPKIKKLKQLDNFDNYIRSETLIDFFKKPKKNIKKIKSKNIGYFIIHPILRSIVINKKTSLMIRKILSD